jgi:hypothetical protein
MQTTVPIQVTTMDATIPEGFVFEWNGRTVHSGPLRICLDNHARDEGDNRGELDYEKNVARAQFNIVIDFTGIARVLSHAAHCELMQPIRAVLHSEGGITEDHNFGLSGPMQFQPHPFFGDEGVSVAILPGR